MATSRIHILDNDMINKIAAGEVVERPASVLKELLDNAVDAGATHIEIHSEQGGTKILTVMDNGSGMSPDDALLSLERHATSKVTNPADLFQIGTLGFRGEALAAISAVSHFSLSTHDGHEGTKVVASAKGVKRMPHTGAATRGTTVTVEDLFCDVPARKRFLKNAPTEHAHCLELVQQVALAMPRVGFVFWHNDREVLRVTPVTEGGVEDQMRARARQVLGADVAESLVFVSATDTHGKVEALVSPPGLERAHAKSIYMFVNGRPVKDKVVRYGILRGYHSHLLRGRYPVAIVRLTLDPGLVDVNVHPAKTELRFQYPGEVQTLIAHTVRSGLRQGAWVMADVAPKADAPAFASRPHYASERHEEMGSPRSSSPSPSAFNRSFMATRSSPGSAARTHEARGLAAAFTSSSSSLFGGGDIVPTAALDTSALAGAEASFALPWSELTFIGSFGRCYLLFDWPGRDLLVVVDQHAFHERILFERLTRDGALTLQSQALLLPEAVDLTPEQIATLRDLAPELANRGFSIAFPSDSVCEVKAVPSLLAGKDVAALIGDLADPESAEEASETNAAMARLILATIACHGAVRSGEDLSPDDLTLLIKEANDVDFYLNCPHGRRVLRLFTRDQVGRWFDR